KITALGRIAVLTGQRRPAAFPAGRRHRLLLEGEWILGSHDRLRPTRIAGALAVLGRGRTRERERIAAGCADRRGEWKTVEGLRLYGDWVAAPCIETRRIRRDAGAASSGYLVKSRPGAKNGTYRKATQHQHHHHRDCTDDLPDA